MVYPCNNLHHSQQNHTLVAIMNLLICHKDVANLVLLYTIPLFSGH